MENSHEDYLFACENPMMRFQMLNDADTQDYALYCVFVCSIVQKDANYFPILNFRFEQEADKTAYINQAVCHSVWSFPLEVGAQDRLITLVTCTEDDPNVRLLLCYRSLREGEKVESLRQSYAEMANQSGT